MCFLQVYWICLLKPAPRRRRSTRKGWAACRLLRFDGLLFNNRTKLGTKSNRSSSQFGNFDLNLLLEGDSLRRTVTSLLETVSATADGLRRRHSRQRLRRHRAGRGCGRRCFGHDASTGSSQHHVFSQRQRLVAGNGQRQPNVSRQRQERDQTRLPRTCIGSRASDEGW